MNQRMATMGEAWHNFWTRWTFAGRASRSEFWFMLLWFILIGFAVMVGSMMLAVTGLSLVVMLLCWLFSLATIIPSICVSVRRLHDIGYSGWWWWIGLLPLVGGLILLILYILPSEPRENRYGQVPFSSL